MPTAIAWACSRPWGAGSRALKSYPAPPGPEGTEFARFAAAGGDSVTWGQTLVILAVFALLVVLGGGQAWGAAARGDWGEAARGGLFVVLGVGLGYMTVVRFPVAYVLTRDPRHGHVLEIARLAGPRVRLRLGDYTEAVPKRVLFAWFPLVSGSRTFGLRGARFEQALLGFWSFGRDGRRAVVLSGPDRPLTLVSPHDPEAFLRAVRPIVEAVRGR